MSKRSYKAPRGLKRALKSAGSQMKLAARLSCSQAAISKWLNGQPLPPKRVLQIEREMGIHRSELRPDLWQQTV